MPPQQGRIHLGVTHTRTGPQSVRARHTHTHTHARARPWFAWSPPAHTQTHTHTHRPMVCPEPTSPGSGDEARHSPRAADLGQLVAEAVAAAAVQAELAQGHDAGRALGEAAGVVRLDGSRDQGIKVLLSGQLYGHGSWGGDRRQSPQQARTRKSEANSPGGPCLPIEQPGPTPALRATVREQTLMERVPHEPMTLTGRRSGWCSWERPEGPAGRARALQSSPAQIQKSI